MTNWMNKKIAERENPQPKQERVDGRGNRGRLTRKLAKTTEEPNTDLLNSLLDQWELREYGSIKK